MSRRSSLAWMEEAGLPSIDTDTTESDAPISDNDVVLTEQEIVNDIEETSAELRYMTKLIRRSEYIADRYVYLFHLHDHVATYGVDRSFVGLADWNGVLSRDLCIKYPNLTNIPSVGSPTSPLSKATIAGLEGAIGGFFKWIGDIFKKFWNWLCSLFGGGKKDSGTGKVEAANEKTEAVLDGIEKDLNDVALSDNEEVLKDTWDRFIKTHGSQDIIAFKKLPAYFAKLSVGFECVVKLIPHFQAGADMLENLSKIVDDTKGKADEIANKVHEAAKSFKDQHQQAMITIANQANSANTELKDMITKDKMKLQDQSDLCSNMRLASRFVAQLRTVNEKMKDIVEKSVDAGKEYEKIGNAYETACTAFENKVKSDTDLSKLKAVATEMQELKTHVFTAGKQLHDFVLDEQQVQLGIFKLAALMKLLVSTKTS